MVVKKGGSVQGRKMERADRRGAEDKRVILA